MKRFYVFNTFNRHSICIAPCFAIFQWIFIVWLNYTYLLTHLLSYPHSRDAIASKNLFPQRIRILFLCCVDLTLNFEIMTVLIFWKITVSKGMNRGGKLRFFSYLYFLLFHLQDKVLRNKSDVYYYKEAMPSIFENKKLFI